MGICRAKSAFHANRGPKTLYEQNHQEIPPQHVPQANLLDGKSLTRFMSQLFILKGINNDFEKGEGVQGDMGRGGERGHRLRCRKGEVLCGNTPGRGSISG